MIVELLFQWAENGRPYDLGPWTTGPQSVYVCDKDPRIMRELYLEPCKPTHTCPYKCQRALFDDRKLASGEIDSAMDRCKRFGPVAFMLSGEPEYKARALKHLDPGQRLYCRVVEELVS